MIPLYGTTIMCQNNNSASTLPLRLRTFAFCTEPAAHRHHPTVSHTSCELGRSVVSSAAAVASAAVSPTSSRSVMGEVGLG